MGSERSEEEEDKVVAFGAWGGGGGNGRTPLTWAPQIPCDNGYRTACNGPYNCKTNSDTDPPNRPRRPA